MSIPSVKSLPHCSPHVLKGQRRRARLLAVLPPRLLAFQSAVPGFLADRAAQRCAEVIPTPPPIPSSPVAPARPAESSPPSRFPGKVCQPRATSPPSTPRAGGSRATRGRAAGVDSHNPTPCLPHWEHHRALFDISGCQRAIRGRQATHRHDHEHHDEKGVDESGFSQGDRQTI